MMQKSSKIAVAAAFAGMAAIGGAAFTGAGLNVDSDAATQFVGGSVSTSVTGATLSDVTYGFVGGATGPQTSVNKVTVTLVGGADKAVTGEIDDDNDSATPGVALTFTQTALGSGIYEVNLDGAGGNPTAFANVSSLAISVDNVA